MLFIESVDVRFNKTGKTFSPKIPGKAYYANKFKTF